MSKKIGILGSGAVAKALAKGFIRHGYEVKLGTRDAAKLAGWQAEAGAEAQVGTVAEAAAFGDALVLAVKGTAAEKVLEQAGLITRGREAQWRPCRIEPGALKVVDDWLDRYRKFWEASFDRLDDYLRETQPGGSRRKRRT